MKITANLIGELKKYENGSRENRLIVDWKARNGFTFSAERSWRPQGKHFTLTITKKSEKVNSFKTRKTSIARKIIVQMITVKHTPVSGGFSGTFSLLVYMINNSHFGEVLLLDILPKMIGPSKQIHVFFNPTIPKVGQIDLL